MLRPVLLLLTLLPLSGMAQIYKCVDASGQTSYSDKVCPSGSRSQVMELTPPASAPPAASLPVAAPALPAITPVVSDLPALPPAAAPTVPTAPPLQTADSGLTVIQLGKDSESSDSDSTATTQPPVIERNTYYPVPVYNSYPLPPQRPYPPPRPHPHRPDDDEPRRPHGHGYQLPGEHKD